MDRLLLDHIAKELLNKFGSGGHKPGSGSAAALQGLLSAQLIHTVIFLTTEEKRRKDYESFFSTLKKMDQEIVGNIIPNLEALLEKDSIQFGRVIDARDLRDAEKRDYERKSKLAKQAQLELIPATEFPIEISELSKRVAEIAVYVFNNGFHAARGDAYVALSGAVAAIGGCISIINLNLLSFSNDEWTEKIRQNVARLQVNYSSLHEQSIHCQEKLSQESEQKYLSQKEINSLVEKAKMKDDFSNSEIEQLVSELQNILWKHKETGWNKKMSENPIDVLNPDYVFRKGLGYQFYRSSSLGVIESDDGLFDVAGIINQGDKVVRISNQFTLEEQKFTAAHELGHAILHKQDVLHRDRSLDGSNGSSNIQERQADKFATFFLMPSKQVQKSFQDRFQLSSFVINDDTAYLLIKDNPSVLREHTRNLRGLSRYLVQVASFGTSRFVPLYNEYNVSIEAMAIRLEELGLVYY